MPIKSVSRSVADHMMSFAGNDDDEDGNRNRKKMSRPFGVAILIAGCDENGAALYVVDPSGTIVRYLAVAVGAGGESGMSILQDEYAKSLTVQGAEDLAADILKQVMQAKIGVDNIEFALLENKTKKFHKYDEKELERIISRIKKEDHEDDDDD